MPVSTTTSFVCTFIACILLAVVSISAITSNVDTLSFLNARTVNGEIHFGVFGYTGSGMSVGYYFPTGIVDDMSPFTGSYFHIFTGSLIMHPIAAGLGALAIVCGLCGLTNCIAMTFMSILTALTASITLVALCVDLGFWFYVRDRIRDQGIQADLSNCIWMTFGAEIAILLGFMFGAGSAISVCRRCKVR